MENTTTPFAAHKARIVQDAPQGVIRKWLSLAIADFKNHLGASLTYGVGIFAACWIALLLLTSFDLAWMILPALAGAVLIGPIATVGLYRISRRAQGQGGGGVASPGQVFLAGTILMVFAMMWVRAATLIFAVFFGLRPFAGFAETMATLLSTNAGIATIFVGTIVGGLFAALGFAVSVFSIPMLVDREVDCFSAMGLSFNATTYNFKLMIMWACVVTGAITVSLLTGFLGLIIVFPVLGYATWHAYCDLFKG